MKLWRECRPAIWQIALAFLTIPLLGLADIYTGAEFAISIFYVLPITWLTWRCGPFLGGAASLLCAVAWFLAEHLCGPVYKFAWVPYWNASVRLGLFLIITILLSKYLVSFERRRLLERTYFHDLLNLAGSLRGFAELLRDESVLNKQEVACLIEETAERLIDEIETQKLLCTAEDGHLAATAECLHPRLLLEPLLAIYRQHPCSLGRTLVLAEPVANCLVWSDPTLLTRVLGNLLKNALEATPSGGTVQVGCQQVDDQIVFSVKNPGEMAKHIREKLFCNGTSTKGRGRGLGLRSIRIMVDVLGGKVELTSSPEEGTTFLVILPVSPAPTLSSSGRTS